MTMTRYMTRLLGTRIVLSWLAVTALLQIFDLFNNARELLSRGGTLADLFTYAGLRLPLTLEQALPIAALIGSLTTLAALTRANEMTALRGAGVTIYRILGMCAPIALVAGIVHFLLIDKVSPWSERRFLDWWNVFEAQAPSPDVRSAIWLRSGNSILRVGSVEASGRRLNNIEIFQLSSGNTVTDWIKADEAQRTDDGWVLREVRTATVANGGVTVQQASQQRWPSMLDPSTVADIVTPAENLSTTEMRRILQGTSAGDHSPSYYRTQLHRSYAFPLASLLMLILAAPAGYMLRRRGGPGWGLGLGFGLGMTYLLTDGLLAALGGAGALPPAVAAWTAPALFALIGTSVVLHYEE